jgi:sulfhydrogenase subunit gamma (sulfur reductase)
MTDTIRIKHKNAPHQRGLYLPIPVKIADVADMTQDVKLFRLEKPGGFSYSPGQFLMVSVWGAGEIPISFASTDGIHDTIELCIRKVGLVTSALHQLKGGDSVGIRGPLGKGFPFEKACNRDVLFVAGGIGLAPLRSLINLVIDRRGDFGRVALIYGSRTPSEVLFMQEVLNWKEKGIDVILTVDVGSDVWEHHTGVVTEFLHKNIIFYHEGVAFICGPHVMISAVMRELSFKGMQPEHIVTTLEAHMKCGVGKCGHCYNGGRYICTDGPVFSYAELKRTGMSGP